jgi:LmbE family N-acetylglucosaminyl deacetylase
MRAWWVSTLYLTLLLQSLCWSDMVWLKAMSNATAVLCKPAKVVLVIAHPDDEVMFFTPTLLSLSRAGHHLSILCLSNGNFEGIGNIRTNELIKSAAMFGIATKDVYVLDDPQLQDGMYNTWPTKAIEAHVLRHINVLQAQLVRTRLLLFE